MSDAGRIGALLRLMCPNGHDVGLLFMRGRGPPRIEYKRAGQLDPPHFWPLDKDGFYSEPVCPGGCRYEVGELADRLVQTVVALANDSTTGHDSYTLTFLGPAQASG
jgi:hypothetical protein